jgi:hypothetical protein
MEENQALQGMKGRKKWQGMQACMYSRHVFTLAGKHSG